MVTGFVRALTRRRGHGRHPRPASERAFSVKAGRIAHLGDELGRGDDTGRYRRLADGGPRFGRAQVLGQVVATLRWR